MIDQTTGKEAVPVRKALLILTLIGGAFAGGMAASNGPAVAWVRSWVATHAQGIVGEEISLSQADPPGTMPATATPTAAPAPPTPSGMSAPAAPAPVSTAAPAPAAPSFPAAPLPSLSQGTGPEIAATAPADAPAHVPAPAAPARTTPPAETTSAAPAPAAAAAAPGPAPAAANPDPGVKRAGGGADGGTTSGDWAALRLRLVEQGVTRYGVEGSPGGAVRFWSLIPLAGQRAVGQQFEAEGDDEFQAAEAVLKRILLWRAMEASAPPPTPAPTAAGLPAGAPGG
jgi:hypothetical protein